MTSKTPSGPRHAPLGCIIALAVPLLLFGLSMLGGLSSALGEGRWLAGAWYALGAILGIGVPISMFIGRRMKPKAAASAHTPFGCYAFLGGIMAMAGASMLVAAVGHRRLGDMDATLGLGIGAVLALGLGTWFIIGGRLETRRDAPLVDALRRDDPEPWRHVPQWADGRIRAAPPVPGVRHAAVAVAWNAVAWPLAFIVSAAPAAANDYATLVWLLPAVGLLLAVLAVRAVRQEVQPGGTVFSMDTFPGVVGGTLQGTVLAHLAPGPAGGADFTLTLRCIRRRERMGTSSSSSHDNRVQTQQLWQEARQVTARVYSADDGPVVAIPVSFAIPLSARPTTLRDPSDRIFWQLEVAGGPAGRVRAEMEVPVFDLRTDDERALEVPELAAASAPEEAAGRATVAPGRPSGERDAAAPARSAWHRIFPSPVARFRVEEDHAGRIDVRSETGSARHAQAGMGLIAAGVLGLLTVMRSEALQQVEGIGLIPIFMIFGGAFLMLIYRHSSAEITLRVFDVTLRNRKVEGGQALLQYVELEGASVKQGAEHTSSRNGVVVKNVIEHDVELRARDGRSWMAGLRVTDRQQAQWVAGTINNRIAASGARSVSPAG
jgi:hypothetical protein